MIPLVDSGERTVCPLLTFFPFMFLSFRKLGRIIRDFSVKLPLEGKEMTFV